MMILISGGNGSGKSAYAEKLASTMSVPRYYIATMVSQSEENERRIEKHRRQRSGLGFVTIEEPCRVSRAVIEPASLVLLEDASNLLGNMIFAEHGTKEDALQEILELQKKCRQLLVVTISGLPADAYEGETAEYIRAMEWLNEQLFAASDVVVELHSGTPECRKGGLDEIS